MALIDELTDLIGHQNAIEIVRGWGGRRLSIPSTIPDHHPITYKIGRDAADLLSHHYGGTEIELPVERSALIRQRDKGIYDDMKRGVSARKVAEIYGITSRHARFVYTRECRRRDPGDKSPP